MAKRKKIRRKKKRKTTRIPKGSLLLLILLVVLLCLALVLLFREQGVPKELTPQQKPSTSTSTVPPKSSTPPVSSTPIPKHEVVSYSSLHTPQFTTTREEHIATHTGYTVSFNSTHRIPNWVGYEMTRAKTKGDEKRSNRFVPDPKFKAWTNVNADYTNSGYDRGHMAPAADMKWSPQAMAESFYFSNICPQHPDLNRRRWKDLEDKVRDWAVADSAIVVVCGPLIRDSSKSIGKNLVTVPDGFFKVILSPYQSSPQAIGFLFNNERSVDPLHTYIVPVDSIESLTGLDFFSELPDSIEDLIESRVNKVYWGF